jgi:HSP20 family protein
MSRSDKWKQLEKSMGFNPFKNFDDIFRGAAVRSLLRDIDTTGDMKMDLTENDSSYTVKVDIPGVSKDDINVSVEGNQVSIQAETRHEESHTEGKEIYSERYVGKNFRSFTLPQEVDSTKCDAQYANGVLTLNLPKKSNGQSKRLPVH